MAPAEVKFVGANNAHVNNVSSKNSSAQPSHVNNDVNSINSSSVSSSANENSDSVTLIWITVKICEVILPVMIDTGATPNCIATRCVEASSILRNLPRRVYTGNQILDANGQYLRPKFVISAPVVIGSPAISVQCEFVVIDTLPFSCIMGQSTLSKFSSWSICNVNKYLTVNNYSKIPFYSKPSVADDHVKLITTNKTVIEPFKFYEINTRASGTALSAFRAVTSFHVISEGCDHVTDRLNIDVIPSLSVLHHQNCTTKLQIFNNSPQTRVIRKGVAIGSCSSNFDEVSPPTSDNAHINVISKIDVIDILCNKMPHLKKDELQSARNLLSQYRDIFSVSNDKVGCTDVTEFDIDTSIVPPVSVPLRRVPIHQHDIVKQIIEKYEQLGLVEPIDSPFRAATVLVKKKNISGSTDITDQYRLCTDYRALNETLPSSGWPAPSLNECLDAANGSNYFSSIDFNSGYHQIPCTSRAKEALAFSPGYGFKQLIWSVMPQGGQVCTRKISTYDVQHIQE